MKHIKEQFGAVALLCCAWTVQAQPKPPYLHPSLPAEQRAAVPPHERLVPLFNGRNFSGFDILLEKHGINHDPDRVFQVEKGMLHISGEEFGGLVTERPPAGSQK